MTMIRWINLVLDVPGQAMPDALDFWCQISGCQPSAPRNDVGHTITMLPAAGSSWLKVRTLAGDVPRVHLELSVDDVDAATSEAVGLGATVHERSADVVILWSPAGVRFALTHERPDADGVQVRDLDSLIDQACLDIPSNRYDAEVKFWSQFTGWGEVPGHYPEFTALERPDAIPVRVTFQRVGSGEAGCHADLACRRALRTQRRHVELGAVVDDVRQRWTVMVGPSGMRYCITERDPITGLLS